MVLEEPLKLFTHVALCLLFLFIFGFFIFRFFSSNPVQNMNFAQNEEKQTIERFSVQVYGLPSPFKEEDFKKLVDELFPQKVLASTLLFDVSKRLVLDEEIKETKYYYEHYEYMLKKGEKTLICGPCCSGVIDPIEFYQTKHQLLVKESNEFDEKYNSKMTGNDSISSTGIGFIVFKTMNDRNGKPIFSLNKNVWNNFNPIPLRTS